MPNFSSMPNPSETSSSDECGLSGRIKSAHGGMAHAAGLEVADQVVAAAEVRSVGNRTWLNKYWKVVSV